MVTVELDDLPAGLKRLAKAAAVVGWSIWATEARVLDTYTVAVRFGHEQYRCYGVWTLGVTPTGKPSAKWRRGASRHGHFFANVDHLVSYLGITK